MAGQLGFFDLDERYAALSESGDPLERLTRVVDFEIFRGDLERALNRSERAKGGRPPMDAVMMFKILVIQALWGLSDEQVEYQIRDRLSFMRFLGLDLAGRVPDYSTVWRFREALGEAGAIAPLFARFDAELKEQGYFALGGQIVDASIVEAPRQRMSKDEKLQIKRGEVPPWPAAKARHKDVDAHQARPREEEARAGAEGVRAAGLGRSDPGLRLQEPHQCRSPASADPVLDGHQCRHP